MLYSLAIISEAVLKPLMPCQYSAILINSSVNICNVSFAVVYFVLYYKVHMSNYINVMNTY